MAKVGIETVTGDADDDNFTQVTGTSVSTKRGVDVNVIGGSVTADTELPAAIAMSDSMSNPTAPQVIAHQAVWDSVAATHKRAHAVTAFNLDSGGVTFEYVNGASLRKSGSGGSTEVAQNEDVAHASGDAGIMALAVSNEANSNLSGTDGDYTPIRTTRQGTVLIAGDVTHDTTDTGNPLKIGGQARQTNPSASVADGDRVNAQFDDLGKQVVILAGVRDLTVHQQTTITNSSAETTILSAGASGVFHDVVKLIASNQSGTAVTVTIKDATAGTTRLIFTLPANSVAFESSFEVPVKQNAAANNWTATLSANTVTVDFFIHAVKNI